MLEERKLFVLAALENIRAFVVIIWNQLPDQYQTEMIDNEFKMKIENCRDLNKLAVSVILNCCLF